MKNHESEKKIMWYSLAFMAFSTVWGFGNVINGFSEYGGLQAIVSWALIFAVYFVPYALMVGENGKRLQRCRWRCEFLDSGNHWAREWLIWQVGLTGLCICLIFHRSQTVL